MHVDIAEHQAKHISTFQASSSLLDSASAENVTSGVQDTEKRVEDCEERWDSLRNRSLALLERAASLSDALVQYKKQHSSVLSEIEKLHEAAKLKVTFGTNLKKAEDELKRTEVRVNSLMYSNTS